MKLNNRQIAEVKNQTGAKPIPAKAPPVADFMARYGRHTFYLDPVGLHFFQPDQEQHMDDALALILVRVARWKDENRESLLGHLPVKVLPEVKAIVTPSRKRPEAATEDMVDLDAPGRMAADKAAMQAAAMAAAREDEEEEEEQEDNATGGNS